MSLGLLLFCGETEEMDLGERRVGDTERSSGRGRCGRDVLHDRRINNFLR